MTRISKTFFLDRTIFLGLWSPTDAYDVLHAVLSVHNCCPLWAGRILEITHHQELQALKGQAWRRPTSDYHPCGLYLHERSEASPVSRRKVGLLCVRIHSFFSRSIVVRCLHIQCSSCGMHLSAAAFMKQLVFLHLVCSNAQ